MKRTFLLPLHLCFLFAGVILCVGQTSRVSTVLSPIIPILREKTLVPLRLPMDIAGLDGENDLHAIIKNADNDGYIVLLGATAYCEGQHVCSYGTLIGTTRPLSEVDFYSISDRKGFSVTLHRGIHGYFYNSVCGAYCSDSLLVWTEGKYHYVIGLKAGTRSELLSAGNSAIQTATKPN